MTFAFQITAPRFHCNELGGRDIERFWSCNCFLLSLLMAFWVAMFNVLLMNVLIVPQRENHRDTTCGIRPVALYSFEGDISTYGRHIFRIYCRHFALHGFESNISASHRRQSICGWGKYPTYWSISFNTGTNGFGTLIEIINKGTKWRRKKSQELKLLRLQHY